MTNTDAATIQAAAKIAYGWLETAKRENGTHYVRHKDGAPEWTRDLAHHVHGGGGNELGMLPDDYRYEYMHTTLEALANGADPDDPTEWLGEPDVYTSDLMDWLMSHSSRKAGADEALQDGIATDIDSATMYAQQQEMEEVATLTIEWLDDNADDITEK